MIHLFDWQLWHESCPSHARRSALGETLTWVLLQRDDGAADAAGGGPGRDHPDTVAAPAGAGVPDRAIRAADAPPSRPEPRQGLSVAFLPQGRQLRDQGRARERGEEQRLGCGDGGGDADAGGHDAGGGGSHVVRAGRVAADRGAADEDRRPEQPPAARGGDHVGDDHRRAGRSRATQRRGRATAAGAGLRRARARAAGCGRAAKRAETAGNRGDAVAAAQAAGDVVTGGD